MPFVALKVPAGHGSQRKVAEPAMGWEPALHMQTPPMRVENAGHDWALDEGRRARRRRLARKKVELTMVGMLSSDTGEVESTGDGLGAWHRFI